jgi:hypothetical protein
MEKEIKWHITDGYEAVVNCSENTYRINLPISGVYSFCPHCVITFIKKTNKEKSK